MGAPQERRTVAPGGSTDSAKRAASRPSLRRAKPLLQMPPAILVLESSPLHRLLLPHSIATTAFMQHKIRHVSTTPLLLIHSGSSDPPGFPPPSPLQNIHKTPIPTSQPPPPPPPPSSSACPPSLRLAHSTRPPARPARTSPYALRRNLPPRSVGPQRGCEDLPRVRERWEGAIRSVGRRGGLLYQLRKGWKGVVR